MNGDAGYNRLLLAFHALSVEEQRELILLPFRDACAQLREVLRRALPAGTRAAPPEQETDRLRIRIYHDSGAPSCVVGVEYLGSTASHLVYEFPRDHREEPTPEECALMDRDPEFASQIEAHYARQREKQARQRQFRDAVIDSISTGLNELQRQLEIGHQPIPTLETKPLALTSPAPARPPYNACPEGVWVNRMALRAHADEIHRSRGRAVKPSIRDDLWPYYYEKNWRKSDDGELQSVYQHAKEKLERADEHTLAKVRARIDEVKAKM